MKIQVNFGDVPSSDALTQHVNERVEAALQHMAEQITRVEVHLRDDNSDKAGPDDKRCTMEARIAGLQPLAVEHADRDLYQVVNEAAGKLRRAVQRTLDRREKR